MKFNPYALVAGAIGIFFIGWLFTSMAVTDFATRILVTLLICIALVALAGFLALRLGRKDEREDDQHERSAG